MSAPQLTGPRARSTGEPLCLGPMGQLIAGAVVMLNADAGRCIHAY